jgi:protein-tyrosine phosphatase
MLREMGVRVTARTEGDGGRDLAWDGCHNARDLGGLPMSDGSATPRGRVVRADSPDELSPAGWAAVWDFGVRTIVDLRSEDESAADVQRPQGLRMYRVSWDDYPDQDWNARHDEPGLPGSMRVFLQDYPEAPANTARALIEAAPGAVLVHCAGGRDRTGLFAIVLGALIGVTPEALFDDYRYSLDRLMPLYRKLGAQQEIDFLESEAEAEHRAQVFGEVRAVIAELDPDAAARVLLNGGLTEAEVHALRTRLLA